MLRRLTVLAGLLLLSTTATTAWASPAGWTVAASADAPGAFSALRAVTFVPGGDDAWAVGNHRTTASANQEPLIEHRSGGAWTISAAADVGEGGSLESVTATSATEAWAVGSSFSDGHDHPAVYGWNGTAWAGQALSTDTGYLTSIASSAPDDVWAVGYVYSDTFSPCGGPGTDQLLEHWDGTSWSSVAAPSIPGTSSSGLSQVTQVGATDHLLALGSACVSGTTKLVVDRYDGSTWTVVSTPASLDSANVLSVAAASDDDIMLLALTGPSGPESVHWNGASWSEEPIAPLPNGQTVDTFRATWVPGTHRYWLAGDRRTASGHQKTLIERWLNGTWRLQRPPSPGRTFSLLAGIAAQSANSALAVGWYDVQHGNTRTLALERP